MEMPRTKRMNHWTIEMPRTNKRMKRQHYYGKSTTQLMDLPIEILHKILLRLPVKLLFRMQSVSRALCNLVKCPSFAAMHLRNTANGTTDEEPQVMVFTHSRLIMSPRLEYDVGNGKTGIQGYKFASNTSNYIVEFVACGLICFKESKQLGDPALLANPVTGETLRLPPCQEDEQDPPSKRKYEWYGMGFDAITGIHKIVCVCGPELDCLGTHVYALGTTSSLPWRRIPSITPPSELSRSSVSAYGNMHWLIGPENEFRNRIISFDFQKEEFKWTPHPNLPDLRKRRLQLINLRGSLAIVDVSNLSKGIIRIEIWVMKTYATVMWEKKYSIDIDFSSFRLTQPHNTFRFLGVDLRSLGAWEHGIFFSERSSQIKNTVFFWDVIRGNIRAVHVQSKIWIGGSSKIFSYTGSLISLRKYGNLIEADAGDQGKNFRMGKMHKFMVPHFMEVVEAAELDYSTNETYADAAERE